MKGFLGKIPLFVWFVIPTLIVLGVGVWFFTKPGSGDSASNADKPLAVSKPVEGTQEQEIVGREHVAAGTTVEYVTNPPTSGNHWAAAAKNGVYDEQLPDEQIIHNLEHGHVWISYKPDVSEDVKTKLKEIVNEDSWKVIMNPRDKNDSKIALVSWGRVLKMDEPDYDKIRDFVKTYRNRGPEKTPD